MQFEVWKSFNICLTIIATEIRTFIWVSSKNAWLKKNNKRFNVASVGPLGYIPVKFMQNVWDSMLQNISGADGLGRKQMEFILTMCFELVSLIIECTHCAKIFKKWLVYKLVAEFHKWTSNMSLTFSNSSFLNRGSVWAMYLLLVIKRSSWIPYSNQNLSILWQIADESQGWKYEYELQFTRSFMVKPKNWNMIPFNRFIINL